MSWHGLLHYWELIRVNIYALPPEFIIGAIFGIAVDRPLRKWWKKNFGMKAELEDIRAVAGHARSIAADLFEHHTGEVHPIMNGVDHGDDDGG